MKEVKSPKKPLLYYYGIVLLIIALFNLLVTPLLNRRSIEEVDYGTFMSKIEAQQIEKVEIDDDEIYYTEKGGKTVYCTGVMDDPSLTERLYASGATFSRDVQKTMSPLLSFFLTSIVPLLLFLALGRYVGRKLVEQAGGKNAMAFGKSNAKVYVQSTAGIHFSDVAGEDEAKESLAEIVDYLHDPKKYTDVGASMPKGILLVGPPGTGKTMLAKAVAGEANVPFFSISGSEFVEMFVGMGASKVRDLFSQAKEKAPCIVFIDEIDAIGQKRNSGNLGGNDEREQTLNQLLVEMDGFTNNEGVIVMAATNRDDILDNALTRPGRFDRRVYIGLPDIRGREAILRVHARGKPLGDDVDLNSIARGTPGFSGADLENLLNEAALMAVSNGRRFITSYEIEEAIRKVQMGPEKKSKIMSERARKLTAYHEGGHAVVAEFLEHTDPVHYITIIPRGPSGGATYFRPKEDLENFKSYAELFEDIVVSLGGRVSEKLFLDDISTGASGDIQQATNLARAMVTQFGMSDRLGPISYDSSGHSIFIGRDFGTTKSYSEETAAIIDEEVKRIFDEASAKAEGILTEHADIIKGLADYLLKYESMEGEDFSRYCHTGKLPEKKQPPRPRDNTIEPPARHISYTFDEPATSPALEQPEPETEPKTEPADGETEDKENK